MRIPAGPRRASRPRFISTQSRVGKPILDVPEPSRATQPKTPRPTLATLGQAHGGSRRARPAPRRRDRGHESPARLRLLRRSEDVGRRRGSVRQRRHDGNRSAGRLRRAHEHPPRAERIGTPSAGTLSGVPRPDLQARSQRSLPPADHRLRAARRPHRARTRHRHRHDGHDRWTGSLEPVDLRERVREAGRRLEVQGDARLPALHRGCREGMGEGRATGARTKPRVPSRPAADRDVRDLSALSHRAVPLRSSRDGPSAAVSGGHEVGAAPCRRRAAPAADRPTRPP